MIEALAGHLSKKIKEAAPHHPASVERLKYGLALMINASLIIAISLGIGALTGRLEAVLIAMAGFGGLRQLSGGLHLKSGLMCVIVSTLMLTVLSFADAIPLPATYATFAAALLCLLLAPTDISRQSRIKPQYYPLLKAVSVIIVLSNLYIQSDVLALAFLVQAVTLIWRRR